MFCVAKDYEHILFEADCAEAANRESAIPLLEALKKLPRMASVSKEVGENLLRLAEYCHDASVAYDSFLVVSASETGDAVRFAMHQRSFGAFLPRLAVFPEIISLMTGFVAVPSKAYDGRICVSIDYALTDHLSDLLIEQAGREASQFD